MKAAERWELDASGTSVLEAIRKSLVDQISPGKSG
jgi:hypothetical protein